MCDDPVIPGAMTENPFCVQDNKLYAVGYNKYNKKWQWRMEVFDGLKWSFL